MSLSRRELLNRSVGGAALAMAGVGVAAASSPAEVPKVPPLPAAREGLGALVIDGEVVVFDAADHDLEPGALAVVIRPTLNKGRNGPQVRTIDGPTLQPCFWDRSAALEREPGGKHGLGAFPIVYVLGRVVERRPLEAR